MLSKFTTYSVVEVMNRSTLPTYSDWLLKASLIQQIHMNDKELSNIHVEIPEFMNFFSKDMTLEELENLCNSVKELNSKAQDVINLMFHMQQQNFTLPKSATQMT